MLASWAPTKCSLHGCDELSVTLWVFFLDIDVEGTKGSLIYLCPAHRVEWAMRAVTPGDDRVVPDEVFFNYDPTKDLGGT